MAHVHRDQTLDRSRKLEVVKTRRSRDLKLALLLEPSTEPLLRLELRQLFYGIGLQTIS